MSFLNESFPLYNLCIQTPRFLLRPANLEELAQLAQSSKDNILPENGSNWMGPWTQLESPEYERSLIRYYLSCLADWRVEKWSFELAIFLKRNETLNETLIGNIGIHSDNFAVSKTVSIGFFLLNPFKGRGLGKEAVASVLQFVFLYLDADRVRSAAHPDNLVSQNLHLHLGFQEDGTEEIPDQPNSTGPRYLYKQEEWRAKDNISVEGFSECRDFFIKKKD